MPKTPREKPIKKLSPNKDIDATFKLIIFGEGGVGKTTLTRRYVTGIFTESTKITIAVDFEMKDLEIDGKTVRLQVWDFAGEKRFRFLLPSYAKGANGGIFVYDVTNPNSLNQLDEWMEMIQRGGGNVPVLMVGSKIDLIGQRKVYDTEAIEIAKSHNLSGYAEVSSKTGENVEEVFQTITNLMLNKSDI
ncbi:MAG TPA: Rab family GTPase [Candidatus Lokiarchaeia archaeon]|nr:Rab family GTPase [Candidatus Lokiarchaeia archaeon]